LDKGNYLAAEDYFLESLKLARSINYKLEIIHALTDLGKFYNKTKNTVRAIKYLDEALKLAYEIKSLLI